MQIGISTACLYPQETEKSLAFLLRQGFRQFEFFFNSSSELKPDYLREILLQLEAYGAKAVSVHPYSSGIESTLFFSEYERRFDDSVELYKTYFQAAAQIGAAIVVLHGDKAQALSEEKSFERFGCLARAARPFGVMLAQENVRNRRSASSVVIARMRKALGSDAAFVLDLKQAALVGENLVEMCRAMGDRLCHLHLNDYSAAASCLLPGTGTADYPGLFRQLAQQKFSGTAVIEVYRGSFGDPEELWRAKQFLEPLCGVLQTGLSH